jgi:type VI secretion system secreted protein Hcp
MPVDAFIMFTPAAGSNMLKPEGETTDATFAKKKAFEIKDFSFGVENKATIGSATSGAGGGKIQFNEFTIKKTVDQASTDFFKNCCAGAHYGVVTIACRKAGGGGAQATGAPYLIFNFATVFTTKIDYSGPGDEGPEESITFAYGALSITYKVQTKEGKMGTTKQQQWSQLTNTGAFPSDAAPVTDFS